MIVFIHTVRIYQAQKINYKIEESLIVLPPVTRKKGILPRYFF